MIKFVSGDFFEYDADIRINTVNCVGVMGAGVALLFKKKYPDMFKEYRKACKNNEIHPGKPFVWEDINLFKSCTIINFPTKIDWRNPSEYEYIEMGLIWLRKYLSTRQGTVVTLPALGCGHGGLDWCNVKNMIIRYLDDIDVLIYAFQPNDSTHIMPNDILFKEMSDKGIVKMFPSDLSYPMMLKGRTAMELYCLGNKCLLSKPSINIIVNGKATVRELNAITILVNEFCPEDIVFILGMSNRSEIELSKIVLEKGFQVVFVIPYGILEFKIDKELQELWDYSNICVVSNMKPDQGWSRYGSINALKLRIKLAKIELVNSSDIDFYKKIYKYLVAEKRELFCINYWNYAIDLLDEIPVRRVGIFARTNRPNIQPMLDALYSINV